MPSHDEAAVLLRVLMEPMPGPADPSPYLGLLEAGLAAEGVVVAKLGRRALAVGAVPTVVHVHWPEYAVAGSTRQALRRTARLLGLLVLARRRGIPALWTAHNVEGHEQEHPLLGRLMWWVFCRLVAGTVLLHAAGEPDLLARHRALRRRPRYATGHGRYPVTLPSRAEARARLGLPAAATVLAQVGQVREYKDPRPLAAAVRAAGRLDGADAAATVLVVAGHCADPKLRAAIVDVLGDEPGVVLRLDRQSDAELADVLAAADVIALHYRRHLNSGPVFLALEAGRRALLPATAVTQALAAEVGEGWLLTYQPPLTGAALLSLLSAAPPVSAAPDLSGQDWPGVVARLVEAYRCALSGAGGRWAPAALLGDPVASATGDRDVTATVADART